MTQFLSRFALALALVFSIALAGTSIAQTNQSQEPAAAPSGESMNQVCSLEWTQADANGDGSITQDEAQGDLKDQFATVDANGDGSISADEYESCGKA